MSPSLNPLELVRKRNKDRTSETIDMIDSSRRFYRTIGSVTFSILLKPNTVTYVYDKVIEPIVAERLAKLEMANEVFTLDIYANANIINEFSDAASLEDILDLGEDCWFAPEHCQMFATDVLAGISALHEVGLQRNVFSVEDVLLVWRQNTFYFQIAGIENCTCIEGDEPTDNTEWDSLMKILSYVDKNLEKPDDPGIQGLKSLLAPHRVLGNAALEAGKAYMASRSLSYKRKELGIYIQAVRIMGTTLGGLVDPNSGTK